MARSNLAVVYNLTISAKSFLHEQGGTLQVTFELSNRPKHHFKKSNTRRVTHLAVVLKTGGEIGIGIIVFAVNGRARPESK